MVERVKWINELSGFVPHVARFGAKATSEMKELLKVVRALDE